jgi:1-acyl-sn-glycerol-3-phosphate acyltransferase
VEALSVAREVLGGALTGPAVREAKQAAQGLVTAVRSGLGAGASRAVDAYGRDEDLVRELSPLLDFLYTRYWRVSVEGAEHVPAGPAILVANHSGTVPFDGPVLHHALLRERPDLKESRWLLEDQVFYAPFFGTLFNRLGALRASPENALRLLEERRPVIVFPEGAQGLGKLYRERYQLKRFGRGGFVKLALRAGVPVVPVAVVGAEDSTPLLAKLPGSLLGLPYVPLAPLGPLPLPAKWAVRFGAPVDLEGLGADAADRLDVVQRLTERTRERIQEMLTQLLRERPGVFTG